MDYKGTVGGIGKSEDRINEITSDDLAVARNYIIGYSGLLDGAIGGVVKDDDHDFAISIDLDNPGHFRISDGMAIAYGYVGWCDATFFDILLPAVEQYHLIYAEFDNSVIPNRFALKIKNNQSSPYYDTAFRRDVLSSVKTGIFQQPLWRIKVTNKGITDASDIRNVIDSIEQAYYADLADIVSDKLGDGTICVKQAAGDDSDKISSTKFAQNEIMRAINQ